MVTSPLNQHVRAHLQTVRFPSIAGVPTPTEKTLLPDPERRRLIAVYSVPRREESTEESARTRGACRWSKKERSRAAGKRQGDERGLMMKRELESWEA
jgi:hypothetical protein